MRDVLRTVDIFRCTADGSIKLDGDAYLENAIERKSLNRVAGKTADLSKLTVEELIAVTKGNADVFRAARETAAQTGKTKLNSTRPAGTKNKSDELATARLIAQAREVITTVVENMDIIIYGTGTTVLADAFANIEADTQKRKAVEQEFGLDFDLIRELFDRGVINTDLVELQVDI